MWKVELRKRRHFPDLAAADWKAVLQKYSKAKIKAKDKIYKECENWLYYQQIKSKKDNSPTKRNLNGAEVGNGHVRDSAVNDAARHDDEVSQLQQELVKKDQEIARLKLALQKERDQRLAMEKKAANLEAEQTETVKQLERYGDIFNTKALRKKIKPIDWASSLDQYLKEVRTSLETSTYNNKRYVLRKFLSWLGNRQPTTELLNKYLTETYESNKQTRNRVGRHILLFCNRFLQLKSRPELRLLKVIGYYRKANLPMASSDLAKLRNYLWNSIQSLKDQKLKTILLGKYQRAL